MIGGGLGSNFPNRNVKRDESTLGKIIGPPDARVEPLVQIPMPITAPSKPPPKVEALPPVPKPVFTKYPRKPGDRDAFPFHVVILSANPANCLSCVAALRANEDLPDGKIVVVDDGAGGACQGRLSGVDWVPGMKPFVFARNANLGIQWAGTDVILLNDDAQLVTRRGFHALSHAARRRPDIAILSAAIHGDVGNANQRDLATGTLRLEVRKLSFVCVYIRAEMFEALGYLDERFVDYGYEDDDYCLRALKSGFKLGVYDPCLVEHSKPLASSFRTNPRFSRLIINNRLRFEQKWKGHL